MQNNEEYDSTYSNLYSILKRVNLKDKSGSIKKVLKSQIFSQKNLKCANTILAGQDTHSIENIKINQKKKKFHSSSAYMNSEGMCEEEEDLSI